MTQDMHIRNQIGEMGFELGPETLVKVRALFLAEQQAQARRISPAATDLHYGDEERQTIDLYAPRDASAPAPVLLWVHGGGFVRGAKNEPDHPYEAHIGRFAANSGMLGAVMNYRLAPQHLWPAGGEDVALAVAWLKENAAQFGGDPAKIVLMGTSAGAAHIATYIQLHPDGADVAGAIMLSGLYGYTPYDDPDRDQCYFGDSQELHAARRAKDALEQCDLPIFATCAEFDPPKFQREFTELLRARIASKGHMPRSFIANDHNHFSQPYHIGTSDDRLSLEILSFIGKL